MPISDLEKLSIDHAYAPDAEPSLLERFDAWATAVLTNPQVLAGLATLVLVLLGWRAMAAYTRVQKAREKAAKRLKEEEEAALLAKELAKLRNERQLKAG